MTWVSLPLALLAGASLGLFGAGGSILLLPILVYVLGMPPRDAMATSLLVLFVTSSTALLGSAARKHIRWRSGVPLGLAAMGGAYAGGRTAEHVAVPFLLMGFALLVIVAAVAMLRAGRSELRAGTAARGTDRLALELSISGVVGFVVGLVGAGGGFLVVPALVLLAGLPLRTAMATSLLIIAMQSLAGLLGHAHHLDLDWSVTGSISAVAAVGSAAGSRLSARIPAARLRSGFAWFLAAVGATLLVLQIPATWLAQLWTHRSPLAAALGGAVLGLAAALLWLLSGRIAGVSGIAGGVLRLARGDIGWRLAFLLGLLLGGWAMSQLMPGAFETMTTPIGTTVAAGLLVGAGGTLANGCTSGHGVCGVSRLSPRSLIAVATFMAAGMVTVYLAGQAVGVQP